MTLARQRTRVGRKVGRKRQNIKANARRAYNPYKKKNFMVKRKPFVEGKSRTQEEVALAIGDDDIVRDQTNYAYVANDDALTHIPLTPFNVQHQGLGEDEMVGLANYTRWIKAKVQILLPEGAQSIQHAADLYMVHGWVKAPFGATSFTTTTPPNVTPKIIDDYIAQHVKDFFDQREDKLRFIPKQNTNLKILGYKRIKPNRNGSLGVPAQAYGTTIVAAGFKVAGANPIINYSATWKVMRKIHYTHGKAVETDAGPLYPTLFPNSSWLPFLVIYNPTFASFQSGQQYQIRVASNSSVWYSDS